MTMWKKIFPYLHPFLFAIAPILFLYASNSDVVPIVAIVRSLIVALCGTLVLFMLFYLFIKDVGIAGIVCSFFLFLFFSYGHIFSLVNNWKIETIRIDWVYFYHIFLGIVWVLVFCLFIFFVRRKLRDKTAVISFLTFTAAIFIVLSLFQIGQAKVINRRADALIAEQSEQEASIVAADALPDVYYIILDGYARQDTLERLFAFDNSEFIEALRSRGFYVPDHSRSNYAQTYLSLSSSLNMEYINYLEQTLGEHEEDRTALIDLIQDSRVQRFFSQAGYEIVNYATGVYGLELDNPDIFVKPPRQGPNEFEDILIDTTALRFVGAVLYRNSPTFFARNVATGVNYSLGHIPTIAQRPEATFTFLHVLSPHPPFIFNADGSLVNDPLASSNDGDQYTGSREYYTDQYCDQLTYLNSKVLTAVDGILANSEREPIIILQADHGSGSHLYWEDPEHTDLAERLSIFCAYYLPEGGESVFYDTMTPVNTFRLILDYYFEENLERLEDASYFSTWSEPYHFLPYEL